jgi:hypothetical protein
VALSRVQSLDGLYLSDFQPQRIAANPTVHEFYKNIPTINPNFEMSPNIARNNVSFDQYELKEEPIEESNIKRVSLI